MKNIFSNLRLSLTEGYLTNLESAFQQVLILVNDFKENESKFISSDYSEADVRKDFIDKFFNALGWDVYHDEQKNPYEQEVKIEKGVYVGKQQKRADYAFHLAPNFRDVKFYVEAKKPSRNLSNADDYFQSIRYGWNAGTQITFLTDFEELHILDCRIKPDISSILNYKIKQYHYSDFLNEEKFSEIYWLLSREAVANNSLEKFAESLPKPKGKAILKGTHRGIYQSIDEAFLEELDEIRDSLAKAFKKANPHLESEPLTEMTQRMIDRLVFIRFLEDKQIEPDHYVSEFANSKSAWKDFKIASRKLDAKYNGVVFKKHSIDSDNFIGPDNKTFSLICEELAHINSPYNFDIIPIHILGSIYERFLGKVVIATDKRVRIEEKPEVRKAGGVYYTPQYIVNYIVDNTVGKLIEGKTPKEISVMRFADISCGSGSFLITVFDRLLEHHRKWYQDNAEQAKKDGCYFQDGKWVLSLKQKQKILTNNIYGVDLDHQAVEVTQLSLYLKLLEDETTATAQDTWVMFKEQLLPNLNNNIICGNSLIGTDILDLTSILPFVKGEDEGGVDELKIKPMNFEDAFPEVMRKGGFDAIVGNPPYVVVKGGRYTLFEEDSFVIDYYKKKYKTVEQQINIYVAFIEKAFSLLRSDGLLGYIVPNTILTNDYNLLIRKMLLDNSTIISLYNEGRVFKNAVVEGLVIVLEKTIQVKNTINTKIFGKYFNIEQDFFKHTFANRFIIHIGPQIKDIIYKLRKNTQPTRNFLETWRGLTTGDDDKYLSVISKGATFKKVIQGKQIERYFLEDKDLYVNYLPNELDRARKKEIFEQDEKIISKFVGKDLEFCYDSEKLYVLNTACVSFIKDGLLNYHLKYFLGLLNSSVMNFYFRNIFTDYRDAFPIIKSGHIEELPIREIHFENNENKSLHDKIVQHVNQMLESKKQLANTKTESEKEYLEKKCSTIDKQIDQLVYELYGLTEEEIKIIEGE